MSEGWSVPIASCVVGVPKAERKRKPYATVSCEAEVIDRGPGGSLDVQLTGIECTYYGAPPTGTKGDLAKVALGNAFMAQITDTEWQNYGLDGATVRLLDDIDAKSSTEVIVTVSLNAEFTTC